MLKQSNYLGASPDSELIQDLIASAKARSDLSMQMLNVKRYVLSEKLIVELFQTKKMLDHFESFGPLKNEEIIRMLKVFYDNPQKRQFRFLKREFDNLYEYTSFLSNYGIFISNKDLYYSTDYFTITINNEKAMNVFEDFAEWFWENYTLSKQESFKIMGELIEKYLN